MDCTLFDDPRLCRGVGGAECWIGRRDDANGLGSNIIVYPLNYPKMWHDDVPACRACAALAVAFPVETIHMHLLEAAWPSADQEEDMPDYGDAEWGEP